MDRNKKVKSFFLVGFVIFLLMFLSGCVGIFWTYANIEGTAIQVTGKVLNPFRPADNYVGYIYWDEEDHNSYLQFKNNSGPLPLDNLKFFSHIITNLERGKPIWAIAVAVSINDIPDVSDSIKIIPGTPIVSTKDIKSDCSYGINWGTLKGELVHMGGASSCQVWFKYGESESNLEYTSDYQTMTTAGGFSYQLTGLESCTTIYYQAFVSNDIGEDEGFIEDFTPGAATVEAIIPDDVGTIYAVLKGSINCLGGTSSCDVWFEYGRSPNNLNQETGKLTVYAPGEFSARVDNLDPSSTYYFKVTADNGICRSFSSTISFDTPPIHAIKIIKEKILEKFKIFDRSMVDDLIISYK